METGSPWNQTSTSSGPPDPRAAAFLVFNCVVLVLALVLGLPGNLWVVWVVFRTKTLQTFNNALLVCLAASDLLKSSVDTPLLLYSFIRYRDQDQVQDQDQDRVQVSVCTLQQFTYALCSCVQLLTLVSISVERYQAIAFPFQTQRRRTRVRLWILGIWGVGAVLAGVSLSLAPQPRFYLLCRPHLGGAVAGPRSSDPFGPFVLAPVWGVALAVIVVHYVRIFRLVRRHRRRMFRRGVQLRPTVSEHAWGWAGVRGGARGGVPEGAGPPQIVGAVCLLTPGARERGKKQLEGKLAQRFGYIIIAFTLFWVPMVTVMMINVGRGRGPDTLLLDLETSAVVLTCVQAAVDPLIYTLVTRQFRSELSKILQTCRPRPGT